MATEIELGGLTVEQVALQRMSVLGITIERYQDPSPPRVSLRGLTVEQHRFSPKRRRLFRKQWW